MTRYLDHATKHFPGGYTTSTILLNTHNNTCEVRTITRFDSGNYYSEAPQTGLTETAARAAMRFHAA